MRSLLARLRRSSGALLLIAAAASCDQPELAPLPADSFAFGVFGDGPYIGLEAARFQRVLDEAARAELQWFLHVGDILSRPCSDEEYAKRVAAMQSLPIPVVYTPGDNEWTDCHTRRAGGFQPLERLRRLREVFFADPHASLGGQAMPLETQGDDPAFSEFVENARWRRGGFVFATVHVVGSANGAAPFRGRGVADDREVERRTQAAVSWLEDAFDIASAERAHGVVLALHGNPRLESPEAGRAEYATFDARLEQLTREFAGEVLLIHGDTHTRRVDHPLANTLTGEPLANFTRLESYGSPDIGWIRVVVDSVAGRIVAYEPRLMPGWMLW